MDKCQTCGQELNVDEKMVGDAVCQWCIEINEDQFITRE
jgi:hypothetical protein